MTANAEVVATLTRKIDALKDLSAKAADANEVTRLANKAAGVERGMELANQVFEEFPDNDIIAFNNSAFLVRSLMEKSSDEAFADGLRLALETIRQEWKITENEMRNA